MNLQICSNMKSVKLLIIHTNLWVSGFFYCLDFPDEFQLSSRAENTRLQSIFIVYWRLTDQVNCSDTDHPKRYQISRMLKSFI